jgi:peptide chain release factor 2
MKARFNELESLMLEPGFWDNRESQTVMKERKRIEDRLSSFNNLEKITLDLVDLFELYSPEDAEYSQLVSEFHEIEKKLTQMEMDCYLSGEDDDKNVILIIHSGAGGTESCDWSDMLLRMYCRFCETHKFDYHIADITPGEEAGIKSATMTINGEYAFGYLKSEIGVHRLVRISPFDSNKRRHTSFASVFVYPQVDDDVEVDINPDDLRIDTYRSSGAGGQHVNKTESAIRVTHIPTGIVVCSQDERSQHKNKDMAMKILRSRIYAYFKEKQEEELQKIEATKKKIEWGSQIRSYVLHPYKMAKDLRTGVKIGDTASVLDGELDPFIKAYLECNTFNTFSYSDDDSV